VGLVAEAIEQAGISTVCLALLPDVARTMRLPRALTLPFPFGFPLGTGDATGQDEIVLAALRLLDRPGPPPVIEDWPAV
jgi:hypothetical protein